MRVNKEVEKPLKINDRRSSNKNGDVSYKLNNNIDHNYDVS